MATEDWLGDAGFVKLPPPPSSAIAKLMNVIVSRFRTGGDSRSGGKSTFLFFHTTFSSQEARFSSALKLLQADRCCVGCRSAEKCHVAGPVMVRGSVQTKC